MKIIYHTFKTESRGYILCLVMVTLSPSTSPHPTYSISHTLYSHQSMHTESKKTPSTIDQRKDFPHHLCAPFRARSLRQFRSIFLPIDYTHDQYAQRP